jgi:hypothetical protein
MVRSGIDRRRGVFILTDTHIPQTSSMTRTVLLVEDDRDIAALVKLHFRISTAGGNRRARTGGAGPGTPMPSLRPGDLDLMLPDLDGLTMCQRLRRRRLRADPDADRQVVGTRPGVGAWNWAPTIIWSNRSVSRNCSRG